MTTAIIKLHKKTLQLIDEVNIIIEETTIKQTLRQIWYRLVSKLILENNDNNYKKVSRAVVIGRKQGLIPHDKIIDPERPKELREYYYQTPGAFFEHKKSYDSLKEYLTNYYIHKWHNQPEYIEVWTEKAALATIFKPITLKYGVTFIVSKGFSSFTCLLEAAKRIKEECKEREKEKVTILYFGDYDPSGMRIQEVIKEELKNLQTCLNFSHIALTEAQIDYFDLSLINLKKTDKNYSWFMQNYGKYGPQGCELDALEVEVLQNIIEKAILEHYDLDIFEQVEEQRQEEISKMVVAAEKLLAKMGIE
nr:MAG: Topo Mini-A/DNA topoisomerase VI, Type II [uncultured archaeon]BDI55248.1 MAG: Topo mini-A [uncultured archaeon]